MSRDLRMADARDMVFISYSHADAEWVQRFKVLLSPLLRTKRLQLWIDTDIRTGDAWHPDIMDAISRSVTALVLVSADFLASDFVMEEELPTLIRHGVRLAPVLVGSSMWQDVPELAGVQWLHDPGRDGALNLVEQPGERDRRLLEICYRLVEVAPIVASDCSTYVRTVPAEPVAMLQTGQALGELFEVPELPPGYIVRDELQALVGLVVWADSGAVGLTGQAQAVGLHGQGGIGKSVLAAALARDEGIRRRFPDGVHWVTVGERADLLATQLDLLARFRSGSETAIRTCAEAVQRLAAVLRDRRVLIVVDDVWSDAAALAFRVTGQHGRVLYTTRDVGVLAACGATSHQVQILSEAEARSVAARVLDAPADTLPAAADGAFKDVGHVALAVALVAAAVRGGQSWDAVAVKLVRYGRTYGDHPYANTFKAMQIAVAALESELAAALLGLAVFPRDIQIPIAAIARYWAHTGGVDEAQTHRHLRTLAAANVLRYEQDTVGFHDLQHDYLLLHTPAALALLHTELLNAYRTALPPDARYQWWRLPISEPYIWDQLVAHLRAAGNRAELSTTVTNPAYLAHRIATSSTHAAEADLTHAAEALPTNATVIWWRQWIARHADILTGALDQDATISSATSLLAPTMLAWLTADQALPKAVDPQQLSSLLTAPYLALRWGLRPPPQTLIRVLTGHTSRVNAVAWSPDSARIASASHDEEVRIWDPTTGTTLNTLTGHTNRVTAVAWSPDGTQLTTASPDGTARIWDLSTGSTILTIRTYLVYAVAWSPDGTQLATASLFGDSVQIWDPSTGTNLTRLAGHTKGVVAVAWSPDGTQLATVDWNDTVRIWDPVIATPLAILAGGTNNIGAVAWSPDGTQLATVGYDRTVEIWDSSTGTTLKTLTGGTNTIGEALAVAWSPDGTQLATASHDRVVRIWDLSTGIPATLIGHTEWVNDLAWSPDGTRLASASNDKQVRIWNPTGGTIAARLTGHTGPVATVAWSPDGARLATAGGGPVRVWDASTGTTLTILTGHTGWVNAVAWSPDGSQLATASNDKTVRIWNPSTGGTILTILTGPNGQASALAWSPDGTQLAVAGSNTTVRIWGPSTDITHITLIGHTNSFRALAWSPDSIRLATSSYDEIVRVWNATTGTVLIVLTGHAGGVSALAWSPDGTQLATASNDGIVLLRDLQNADTTRLRLLPLRSLAWSTTGIAVGNAHSDVIVLEVTGNAQ